MIESDARTLADRLAADFPEPLPFEEPAWRPTPAARAIDCVLSLRKPYETVVKPRIKAFTAQHPATKTTTDLLALIASYPSPLDFHRDVLDMNSPGKATALVGVLGYLADIQHRFAGSDEPERLRAWADWARPGDHLTLDVRGFGLAGFQYLRMLFGAQTTKPDVHILAYVGETLGRPPATGAGEQIRAVYAIERAGELLSVPIRSIDVAIWERQTGGAIAD